MSPEQGWHGYWVNPGDLGGSLKVDWLAPRGVTFGKPSWPAPKALTVSGMTSYVVDGDHDLVLDVKVPKGMAVGTEIPIVARMTWFVCSADQCASERGEASIVLEVGDGSASDATSDIFRSASMALPRPLADASARRTSQGFLLRTPLPRGMVAGEARVYLDDPRIPAALAQSASSGGDRLEVAFSGSAPPASKRLSGVISDGRRSYAFTAPFGSDAAPAPTSTPDASPSTAAQQMVAASDPVTVHDAGVHPARPRRVANLSGSSSGNPVQDAGAKAARTPMPLSLSLTLAALAAFVAGSATWLAMRTGRRS
jgi:DsbC/DsbD-like thiol-disulfide interchange protein